MFAGERFASDRFAIITWVLQKLTMRTLDIAVLEGDGIGPEVIAEGLRVLQVVERKFEIRFNCKKAAIGAKEYLRNGDPLPKAAIDLSAGADAILLGAAGLPDVRWPDGREMAPQIDLREHFGLYAGVRPIRLLHAAHSPLRRYTAGGIDLVIYRESTEGLFASRHRAADLNAPEVHDTLRITRATSERLFRAAFEEARRRRKLLTLVDKANVLPSMVYFRHIFDQIAGEFPDVRTERVYVDAAALYLVQSPHRFDVMVMENMFGDILSDLAAGIIGGMGMAPSADIGADHAVFQPSHGSAPDIAGRGCANPVATVLSVAMMLEWLEEPDAGQAVRDAVQKVLADPANATPDIGGSLTTAELGGRIAAAV
jgi:3-isopropylmalate dehydrogenase